MHNRSVKGIFATFSFMQLRYVTEANAKKKLSRPSLELLIFSGEAGIGLWRIRIRNWKVHAAAQLQKGNDMKAA